MSCAIVARCPPSSPLQTVSYQALLPEALAVVLAPTDPRCQVGVFRLSETGMRLVLACPLRGFHPHEEPRLYAGADGVSVDPALPARLIDLRSQPLL